MDKSSTIIGIDLGDKYNQFCCLETDSGEVLEEGRVPCTPKAMAAFFGRWTHARVAMEAGTHSRWVSALAHKAGHEAIVANPRKVRAIYANERKSDKVDAAMLARIARVDPHLLCPVYHRGPQAQADRAILRARHAAVQLRTKLVNQIRGTVKSFGVRLPACGARYFAGKVRAEIPDALRPALDPLLDLLEQLNESIKGYEKQCQMLCKQRYPETAVLQSVPGVGPLTSLAFVLTLEDPSHFADSRTVGAFLGLTSKRDQSGSQDPQLRISKCGDRLLRSLLVGCAQYILGPFGPDCHLRQWGLAKAARGGRGAKSKAVVAVARKLAVLLHMLWSTGMMWEPFPSPCPPGKVRAEIAA